MQVEETLVTNSIGINFGDIDDNRRIEVTLVGHEVVGGGYSGGLLCTGLTRWRVADLTSRFIGGRSKKFADKSVLELGCGLGLCGIVAAHAVGMQGRVLLTDRDAEVLELAASNILKNCVHKVARTACLEWDDDATAAKILDDQLNFGRTKNRGFDIIIGSDCLYSGMDAVKQLFKLVAMMLTNDSGCPNGRIEPNVNKSEIESSNACRTSFDHCDHREMDTDDAATAPTSLNGGGWKFLDCDVNDPGNRYVALSDNHSQAVFILGYERRLGGADIDMSAMFSYASDLGFEWCIAEDSVIDIFGNETSEQTLFWEQCVLLFTRRKVYSEII